jgi:hypothetical protein
MERQYGIPYAGHTTGITVYLSSLSRAYAIHLFVAPRPSTFRRYPRLNLAPAHHRHTSPLPFPLTTSYTTLQSTCHVLRWWHLSFRGYHSSISLPPSSRCWNSTSILYVCTIVVDMHGFYTFFLLVLLCGAVIVRLAYLATCSCCWFSLIYVVAKPSLI